MSAFLFIGCLFFQTNTMSVVSGMDFANETEQTAGYEWTMDLDASTEQGLLENAEKLIYPKFTSASGISSIEEADSDRDEAVPVILKMARQALEEQFDHHNYRFEVNLRWIPGSLAKLPPKSIIDVKPQGSVERYTTFEVTYTPGSQRRRTEVQLQVDIEQWLPVIRERVLAGAVVQSDDIDMKWVPVSRDRGQLIIDAAEIEGNTLRRTMAPGEPVRTADITARYLIEAGDRVTLIFKEAGMRIEVAAVARQNGSENDEIRVYSNDTRRTYQAIVDRPGEVKWKRTL
ncbi:MAG: flagellar basal body P-ring formation chaperone FlgA [Balneolales bacterium]